VDAVKRAGKFVVTGLQAHGCRGHDDTQVVTAPVTLGSPQHDDFASSACGPAKHRSPLHCAASPPPPRPSVTNFVGKGKGPARTQGWRNELRRPRSPSPRRLGSPDRQSPLCSRRTRDYPTTGAASGRSRSSSPARSRRRTRSRARPDGGSNILWFPRRTFGHFKSLPLNGKDLVSLDDGSRLSRRLVDGVFHWLLTRLRGILPTDGGLRVLASTVADNAPRAARGDFDSANRGVEAMRRHSVFLAGKTILPFIPGSSWSAVIIHGLNAILPHIRHAMGLALAAPKSTATAEMVVIVSKQDKDASYDEGYINGIYRILATTFAYVHMKGRGARKNTLAVERVLRELLPTVERRPPYPTSAFCGGESIISYLAFYVPAHPTAAARLRLTDRLWTLSATLPDARQAVRNLVGAQQRLDDAAEDEVAATLLCAAQLVRQRSTSDDDGAPGGTPRAPPGPDGGDHPGDPRAREGGSGFGSQPSGDPDRGSGKQGVLSLRASPIRRGGGGKAAAGCSEEREGTPRSSGIGSATWCTQSRKAIPLLEAAANTTPGDRFSCIPRFSSPAPLKEAPRTARHPLLPPRLAAGGFKHADVRRRGKDDGGVTADLYAVSVTGGSGGSGGNRDGSAVWRRAVSNHSLRNVQARVAITASTACPSTLGRARLILPRRSPVPPACSPRSSGRAARGAPLLRTGFRCFRSAGWGCATNVWTSKRAMITPRSPITSSPTLYDELKAARCNVTSVAEAVPHVTRWWSSCWPHDGGHPCNGVERVDAERRGDWHVPDQKEVVSEHSRQRDDHADDVRSRADDNDYDQALVDGCWGDKVAAYVTDAKDSYVPLISDRSATTDTMSFGASTTTNSYDGDAASDSEQDSHSESIGSDSYAASDTTRSSGTDMSSSSTSSGVATGYKWEDGSYVRGGRAAAALRQRIRALRSFGPFSLSVLQDAQSTSSGELSDRAGKVCSNNNAYDPGRSKGTGSSGESVILTHGVAYKDACGKAHDSSGVDTEEAVRIMESVPPPRTALLTTATAPTTDIATSRRGR